MLLDDIKTSKDRLVKLSKVFAEAMDRRAAGVAGMPLPQNEAAQRLRDMAHQRAALIQSEIPALLIGSQLLRERTSLLLRYRSPIFGDEAQIAADIIAQDLDYAAKTDDLAANMLVSAGTFAPMPAEMEESLKYQISASLAETRRITAGIIECIENGPLTLDQERAFHRFYESPDDPLLAYVGKTENLAQSVLALTELNSSRIEQTMQYVDCIDRIIKPSFPEHAAGMETQAECMIAEAAGSLARGCDLIKKAMDYADQLASPKLLKP